MLRTVSVALILAVGAGLAHADSDIYRWKDAQGVYHYSDQWVPGSELIKSSSKQQVPTPSADSRSASDSDSLPADAPPTSEATQAVKDDLAKVRSQQCKEAKDAYEKAIVARRIVKSDKDGQKEYLSDADADAYRVKVRTEMDAVCGTSTK
jgi:hypothetical protein